MRPNDRGAPCAPTRGDPDPDGDRRPVRPVVSAAETADPRDNGAPRVRRDPRTLYPNPTTEEKLSMEHSPVGNWFIVIAEPKMVQCMSDCTCGNPDCQHVAVTYPSDMFHYNFSGAAVTA